MYNKFFYTSNRDFESILQKVIQKFSDCFHIFADKG